MRKLTLLILCFGFCGSSLLGQANVYNDMSLEEILNVDVIVSASKKPEDLFDAPLSVTIIKKQEIVQSGATSIPEALRLAPGLIVREMTPGNFDVHIRGFDDVLRNSYIVVPFSNIILVMIDNRIVYSYYSGGTNWEELPVDINDVERIEVVRGPASALYGPNAAAGVINIITSHAKDYGSNISFNSSAGMQNAYYLNGSYGYNWDDKARVSISANYKHRNRWDKLYYDWKKMDYVPFDSLGVMFNIFRSPLDSTFVTFQEINAGYQASSLSLDHLGVNAYFDYNFSDKTTLKITSGYQKTLSQKPYFSTFSTAMAQLDSWGYYTNARFNVGNLHTQFSYSADEKVGVFHFHSEKSKIADLNIEYDFSWEKFSVRPGINLRQVYANNAAIMEDAPYYIGIMNEHFGSKSRSMSMAAFSMLGEWKPTGKLRLISGFRIDKFSINNQISANYELGATYRLNKNNMLRFLHSRANRAPFLLDTYSNMNAIVVWPLRFEQNQEDVSVYAHTGFGSEQNVKYLTNNSIELAWRSKVSQSINFDVETFISKVTNLSGAMIYRNLFVDVGYSGDFPDISIDSILGCQAIVDIMYGNYDISALQKGATASVQWKPMNKLSFKVFGTIQDTRLLGNTSVKFDTLQNMGVIRFDPVSQTLTLSENIKITPTNYNTKSTPTFFGGLEINYSPFEKTNLNVNGYYMTRQTFTGLSYEDFSGDREGNMENFDRKIVPNIILNSKITYNPGSKISVYLSARNVIGKHREFGFADNIGSLYMAGVSYNF